MAAIRFPSNEVTQIERLCGYTRLDNGELAVIDGRMFVVYHTISENGGCTADGNVPGREWLLRMKVSDDFSSSQPTFHDLGGGDGFDLLPGRSQRPPPQSPKYLGVAPFATRGTGPEFALDDALVDGESA